MSYVWFFAILLPFQLLVVVAVLRLVRRKTFVGNEGSWSELGGKVFLLMLAVNVISLLPGVGLAAVVVWLIGLKRLSGLDVLSTFILSFTVGVVCLVAMVLVARYLEIPLAGRQLSN